MKKSEKLLDAIGQIDDQYVDEAARAGKAAEPLTQTKTVKAVKKQKKRAAMYRWQGALAACAVLAVCIGIFALMEKNGVLLDPFGTKESRSEGITTDRAAAQAVPEDVPMEAALDAGDISEQAAAAGTQDEQADAPKAADPNTINEQDSGTVSDKPAEAAQPRGLTAERADAGPEVEEAQQSSPELQESDAQKLQGRAAIPEEIPAQVTVLRQSKGSLTFKLENTDASAVLTYGEPYDLEQLKEGIWQEVPNNAEIVWKEIAFEIEAGGSREETVDYGQIYGELPAGSYRLVKMCRMTAGENTQEFPVYAEFEVTE